MLWAAGGGGLGGQGSRRALLRVLVSPHPLTRTPITIPIRRCVPDLVRRS